MAAFLALLAILSSHASAFLAPPTRTHRIDIANEFPHGALDRPAPSPLSSFSASSDLEEIEESMMTDDASVASAAVSPAIETKKSVPCPDCDLCDGSGRILGGIGTLFDWWPIKAYRPCPNFVERGGKYVRSGQGLDEIAFGRIQNTMD